MSFFVVSFKINILFSFLIILFKVSFCFVFLNLHLPLFISVICVGMVDSELEIVWSYKQTKTMKESQNG